MAYFAPYIGGRGLALGFMQMVAAILAANLATLAFVAALVQAQRTGGFKHPTTTWAGLLMPLSFIVGVMLATGGP